jgi:murein DD-endopeptidase MepM/ murein hydrolase activator NlpD
LIIRIIVFLRIVLLAYISCNWAWSTESTFFLSWPTPNPSFVQGLGYSAFLQKTGPGKEFSSGAYGCVRNNGYKFHEGVDLFPVKREQNGRALDSVFSAMSGRVVYINNDSTKSSYGRYIVLEHEQFRPILYSLYAHLGSFSPPLKVGNSVKVAQVLGRMGNSSSFSIPLNRSHLHFEIGLRLSQNFQNWYNRKTFKTPNTHGNFNGYNLVGIDPLPFFKLYQSGDIKSPADYFENLKENVSVAVKSNHPPSILSINPTLEQQVASTIDKPNGWICRFGPYGIPLSFEKASIKGTSNIQILTFNESASRRFCRKLVEKRNNLLMPSEQLEAYLEILFSN